jgi:hypothetical protein
MSNEVYHDRAIVLKELRFADYRSYLGSALWNRIRNAVLKRDGYWCRRCGKVSAHHVHHGSYSKRTLTGRDISKLYSVCDWCHLDIEFDGDKKRDGSAVMAFSGWIAVPNADVPAATPKPRRKQGQKPKVIVGKYTKQVAALEQQAKKRQEIEAARGETKKQSWR